MAWREQLREASFRGVAFKVASHSSDQAGRRVQVHEYPGRDRPYPEDLGLKTREFSIEAYVLGKDYMAARDQLIDACAKAGAGLLIHPYLGRQTVICTACQVSERVEEGGVARVHLSFVDSGDNTYPSAVNDTGRVVDLRATDALSAVETSFASAFDVTGLPAFVSDSAEDVAGNASSMFETAAGRRVSGTFAAAARSFNAEIGTLIRTPSTFASRLTGLASSAIAETGGARDGITALTPLTTFGDQLPIIARTTATRVRQAANQSALASLVRRTAIIETARLGPTLDFAFSQEAMDLRDGIGGLLDQEMDTASSDGDDLTFTALRVLRAAVVKDLNGRAPQLARLIEVVADATEPALVTAQRLYGDASRGDEIAARNRLRHPGFVPGGVGLEVLSRGGANG